MTYARGLRQEAVEKIISLQTNASVLEMLRKSGPRMNERSLPEMRGYLKRIGYEVSGQKAIAVRHSLIKKPMVA